VKGNLADFAFRNTTLLFAAALLVLILLLFGILTEGSLASLKAFGLRFVTSSTWDPVRLIFGALPPLYGTLLSSLIALVLAVPIGLGTAVFLAELCPRRLKSPVSFLVELLAALPSVVYGLWGLFVLVPALRPVETWLGKHFGFIPLFQGAPYGIGLLAAGMILAIMILPIITSVSREVLLAVPHSQKEAAYALGATHWEALRGPILRYARAGLLGAIILGLGRALGETMAVTMVIGNSPKISASLFSPASTLASVIANEFLEATDAMHISALAEIALLLFIITIIVNSAARLLVWSVTRGGRVGVRE
jgi:phosphate transport system permease protein